MEFNKYTDILCHHTNHIIKEDKLVISHYTYSFVLAPAMCITVRSRQSGGKRISTNNLTLVLKTASPVYCPFLISKTIILKNRQ